MPRRRIALCLSLVPVLRVAGAAYTLRDYPNQAMASLGERLDAADGFVFVTPEYTTADLLPR